MVEAGPRVVSAFSVNGSERRGPFDDSDCAILRAVMPHLLRALQIHRRLNVADATSHALASAIHRASTAVFLVDAGGRVIFMNGCASRIAVMRDGIAVENGELRGPRVADTMRIRELLADAVKTSSHEGRGPGGMLAVGRPSGRRPLTLIVSPMLRRPTDLPGTDGAAAMVFVSNPDQVAVPDDAALRALYALTPAEAKLTKLRVQGLSLNEAAARLGLRRETVRSRVKSVFEKTTTCSQSELVALILATGGGQLPHES
jgi:DNA-binding CsgD family transcriptional regulator